MPANHLKPDVWVIPESETGVGDRFEGNPGQMLSKRIAVLVLMGTPGKVARSKKPQELSELLNTVRGAIAGIQGLEPKPVLQSGSMMRVEAGEIWWQDVWQVKVGLVIPEPPPVVTA